MTDPSFNFRDFLSESRQTLLRPREYFATMKTTGGFTEPLVKAAIYGALAGFLFQFWIAISLIGRTGSYTIVPGFIREIITITISALIGLIIGTLIMLVLSSLARAHTNMETNARVAASLLILMPVKVLFGFAGLVGYGAGLAVDLLIDLYGVLMVYHALTTILNGDVKKSRTVAMVLAGLVLLFVMGSINNHRRGKDYFPGLKISIEQVAPEGDVDLVKRS